MKIEVVSTQHLKPSSLTPPQLRHFKLSFIDERIPPSYTPLILYYTPSGNDGDIKQQEMCHLLKTSLADALVQYYPLAGRMEGQILVDCNDAGILYAEASADGKISDVVMFPESGVLDRLVPFINGYVTTAQEQLAVQITLFSCGGIAIGICLNHRIADHSSLSSFIHCWAAMSRGADTTAATPVLNAATLFPPRNTPDFKPNFKSPSIQPQAQNVIMKRFIFNPSAINSLKQQVAAKSSILNPTRVMTLTAFLWHRMMLAKGPNRPESSVVYHPVNLREKIPPLKENSFGNIFQMISAESGADESDWVHLVEKLKASLEKMEGEHIKKLLGEKGFEVAKENFMAINKFIAAGNVAVFRFSSACRFRVYEADFGWGKPIWVSNATYRNKDCVFLFDSVQNVGGIEAWVVMSDEDMERLEQDMDLCSLTSHFHA